MFERTIESHKLYADPFNDVDVDVVFDKDGKTWRVPAFWRGGNSWTVRFAPPEPGEYSFRLESTDKNNPDLNGHDGHVTVIAYRGKNQLLRHGMIRVSKNRRYFEHADGTPFFWFAGGGSSAGPPTWAEFKKAQSKRKEFGYTVADLIVGYSPYDVSSTRSANEGGDPWKQNLSSINPRYFDFADRRVDSVVNAGMVPVIFGAWADTLDKLGLERMKKHWRYLIARYGAYPVIWVLAGEVDDSAAYFTGDDRKRWREMWQDDLFKVVSRHRGEWSQVAAYIRKSDPYHHPLTAHELNPDEQPLNQESLTDFHCLQPAHFGYASVAVEVARLDLLYSRADVTKPIVVCEINGGGVGMENSTAEERAAFWLALLNGAAGMTQGGDLTDDFSDEADWRKSATLHKISIAVKLVKQYPWWEFAPHPEWVSPHGTTLFEARRGTEERFHMDLMGEWGLPFLDPPPAESEWHKRHGDFHLPYASGVPRRVRFVYTPVVAHYGAIMAGRPWPTVLRLETGVRYHALLWAPASGVHIDLGSVEAQSPGPIMVEDKFQGTELSNWKVVHGRATARNGTLIASGDLLGVLPRAQGRDLLVSVGVDKHSDAGLVARYHDENNFLTLKYSAKKGELSLVERQDGVDGDPLGATPVGTIAANVRLSLETKGGVAMGAITDETNTYSTPIVDLKDSGPGLTGLSRPDRLDSGLTGLWHGDDSGQQDFADFQVRDVPSSRHNGQEEEKLVDARGTKRGTITVDSGDLLLDSYRPPKFGSGWFGDMLDWLLVLDADSVAIGERAR